MATRLTWTRRASLNIRKNFRQCIDAIEVCAALRHIASQAKGVIKLGAGEQHRIFKKDGPFLHQWPAQRPSGQDFGSGPRGYRQAAQLV